MNSGIDKSYNVNALTSHLNSTQLREIMKYSEFEKLVGLS
jgi:hypothetical protein